MSNAHTSMLQAIATARMARVDPPRFDPRTATEEKQVVVRVRCRPTMQIIGNGHIVYATGPDGTPDNFVTCYESEAAAILAMVEDATPAQLAEVERELDRRLARWQRENPEKARDGGQPISINFYSAFEWVMGRGMRPLIEAEILGPAT